MALSGHFLNDCSFIAVNVVKRHRQLPLSHYRQIRHLLNRPKATTDPKPCYNGPAFAFDVDGVIWKARHPIPFARPAFENLFDAATSSWRVPLVFLTNSGGVTEDDRAAALSSALDLPVTSDMVVLSHTPLRSLASDPSFNFSDTAVLTVGGPRCAHIVRATYGFPHALDTTHMSAIEPAATPLAYTENILVSDAEMHASKLPISAIFVMGDSKCWGRDIQLLLDLTLPRNNYSIAPHIYFTNSDILFPTKFAHPRLAGGALQVAFKALWQTVSQGKFPYPSHTLIGKPHPPNYECAEQSLMQQLDKLGYDAKSPPHRIYAVGDNPSSDMRGANGRGGPWRSVLVQTGNFSPSDNIESLPDTDRPHIVVANVFEAVQHGWKDAHENK